MFRDINGYAEKVVCPLVFHLAVLVCSFDVSERTASFPFPSSILGASQKLRTDSRAISSFQRNGAQLAAGRANRRIMEDEQHFRNCPHSGQH